jgi:hypothetical protein
MDQEQELQEPERSSFLISLLAKRKEAITARQASGIEEEWQEDDEHYNGIDDANRQYQATYSSPGKRWATNDSAPRDNGGGRSVVFLNITAPYVDAAGARVSDMLLPTDDRAWIIKPTPIPRLSPFDLAEIGGEDGIEAVIEQAKESADEMQSEIDDCLVESNWHGEVRVVIEDSARIGSGVLKGPYPVKRTTRLVRRENGSVASVSVTEIKPGSRRIDPWDFYPDGSCGESVHNGSYTWEREYLSSRQVADMVGMPGYDKAAILAALKEGPKTASEAPQPADGRTVRSRDQFELWIFYGTCDADDLQTVGVSVEDETPKASAMAVLLNDRLIKCTLNVLDSGRFPYDVLAWQRRSGLPWGTGVSRKIRTVQRILNGALRAMMDNSGLTVGPQIVIGNGITPADSKWAITGRKLWRAEEGVTDVRGAFFAFVPPSIQGETMNIIEWAMRRAEDATGMPAMLQGIRGDAPETLGGMQMQNNNASSVLRRLAKRFDDYVTEPHITRYYEWMMQHSEREEIKGDFQIDVRASSALVERDAQQQFLLTLLSVAKDPAYEVDPAKLMSELLKGQRYDPKRIRYDLEKLAMLQDNRNPVEEAKAKLLQAQARNADANAFTRNTEGLFSAVSAANQIAMNPAISVPADQIAKSAGFVDADQSPAIPSMSPVVQPAAMPTNTSPNLPPNPGAGMNAGIETGEVG